MFRLYITVIFLGIPCVLMAGDFQHGEWEFSVKYTISGMPVRVPTQKFRQCMKDNTAPTVFLQAQSCDVLELSERHQTIRYKVNCFTDNGTLVNEGKLHITGGRMRGTSKSDLGDAAGRNSVIRYKFTGKYLGACK